MAQIDLNLRLCDGFFFRKKMAQCHCDRDPDHSLIAGCADINKARAENGATPLFVAAENGNGAVVGKLLMAMGVDVNRAGIDGSTPLRTSIDHGHDVVSTLLLRDLPPESHRPSETGERFPH